jgi:hypothetical protein
MQFYSTSEVVMAALNLMYSYIKNRYLLFVSLWVLSSFNPFKRLVPVVPPALTSNFVPPECIYVFHMVLAAIIFLKSINHLAFVAGT